MKIEMRLFATFRENRQKVISMEVPEGTDAAALIKTLNISPNEIAILLINGRNSKPDHVLQEGDTVSLFPPIGGG